MKGIILAGGSGSRLYPLTKISSKQLQGVYDKPMVYYPLTTLIAAGIREICIVTSSDDAFKFKNLLEDGAQWGISISYIKQPMPNGIAESIVLAEEFIDRSNFVLILGDNIFSGGKDISEAIQSFKSGAKIFAYHVPDPERYGVVEFDKNMRIISLQEKPTNPSSNFVVPGLYIYDDSAVSIAKGLKPSARGELEITDVNIEYLKNDKLMVSRLSRGFAWFDSGTSESLFNASSYIASIERRQGIKIGCPEEAALVRGFIDLPQLKCLIRRMPKCSYGQYLNRIAESYNSGFY